MSRWMIVAQLDLPKAHRVPRPAEGNRLLAVASAELEAALAASPAAVAILSPIAGLTLAATASANNLYASLLIGEGRLVTIGAPRRATAAPRVWAEMTTLAPSQLDRPVFPWVAMTSGDLPLPAVREVAVWLVTYAAAIGWAWTERSR